MYPFGVIGVASRYIPAGAVIELAGFRLSCTSAPTGIRETQAGGNRIQVTYPVVVASRERIQGHLSRGGILYLETRGQLLLEERINIVLLILLPFPRQVPGITRYYSNRGASFSFRRVPQI